MIQPYELQQGFLMKISNDIMTSTEKVWEILSASNAGDLELVRSLVEECPELAFAQYNYTMPIHFAALEGHEDLVTYLLGLGAHDPTYKIYPFGDYLETMADERNYSSIVQQLKEYKANPELQKYKGDNGEIFYNRSVLQKEFEKAVDKGDLEKTEQLLKNKPELVEDKTYFWGEGILTRPTKENNRPLVDLLIRYGAKFPELCKWARFYYFEKFEMAKYLLEIGFNPNLMSWHHTTLLHDMAQSGDIQKAQILIQAGADINPVEEEYRSTPLGMASRWGQVEMVGFLLDQGADPKKSGAEWSTPLAWALKKNHSKIVDILKYSGAN